MKSEELTAWRRFMGYSRKKDAASALGISENAYRALESGETRIDKRTALACAALYLGADKINQPWLH
ncbi:helix-turn-helix protein [compost metagenome]